ncbi:MAG TPA: hypothetical protein VFF24_09130 [Acidimicrobiia bacterium]|nr:hypothetical protein [Acidimicrobiia bacterium]
MGLKRTTSGWCETGHHGRCCYVLQDENQHRPRIECSCSCHAVRRAEMAATATAAAGGQTT